MQAILESFDLLSNDHSHVILHPDKKHGLVFNRLDGSMSTLHYDDVKQCSDLRRVGRTHGIIGKYLNKYLVLIKSKKLVGTLYEPSTEKEHDVFVINQVQVIDISCLPPSTSSDTRQSSVLYEASKDAGKESDNVRDTHDFSSLPITISSNSYYSAQIRSGPWNPFKFANSLKPKIATHLSNVNNSGSSLNPNSIQTDDSDRRLVDEMVKLFNNTNSFYFSPTLDLTSRMARRGDLDRENLWRTADTRFFWNRHMLRDLIELSKTDKDINYFICVILQGFIAIQRQFRIPRRHLSNSSLDSCVPATSINAPKIHDSIDPDEKPALCESIAIKACDESLKTYQLALISRRSIHHAGTRYRKRGCDDRGNCANFVETEQIFRYNKHFTSVIILRGSIPLYWYQTAGYNYRPPPILCRTESENQEVFKKHFESLFETYNTKQIIVVDCTEQVGRERALHDAYKRHLNMLRIEVPHVNLIEFDFHKHCKGRQCSDYQVERHLRSCGLTDKLLRDVKYYWSDGGVIWEQLGVFRVNCLDCSDRTNVVQRAISLQILDLQLARLGLITPDTCPDDNDSRRLMQIMWATNGNVLSTQYCGTRALFGTADRKLASYIRDTYSSASRYYMSKFRDAYRQAAIDAMLGSGDANSSVKPDQEEPHNENYELINLEPFMTSHGGKLLNDVGSRVTNKLAKLTEKFSIRGIVGESADDTANNQDDFDDPDLVAAKLDDDILSDLNIDWPSSESVENEKTIAADTSSNATDIFASMAKDEDNFQDDEFGQLMLSMDLDEIQRFRAGSDCVANEEQQSRQQECEKIILTESQASNPRNNGSTDKITTTMT